MSARRWIGCGAMLAVLPLAVLAHRLDEYLQAARISLARDRIELRLDLTPGVAVLSGILGAITTQRESRISAAEGRAYANRVLHEIVFELDGRKLPLELVRVELPTMEALSAGVGTIRIEARGAWSGAAGPHALFYRNTHRPDCGVYLVNALVPAGPDIELGVPQRDALQREFRLAFRVTGGGEVARVPGSKPPDGRAR